MCIIAGAIKTRRHAASPSPSSRGPNDAWNPPPDGARRRRHSVTVRPWKRWPRDRPGSVRSPGPGADWCRTCSSPKTASVWPRCEWHSVRRDQACTTLCVIFVFCKKNFRFTKTRRPISTDGHTHTHTHTPLSATFRPRRRTPSPRSQFSALGQGSAMGGPRRKNNWTAKNVFL